jgi:hypothetical protein
MKECQQKTKHIKRVGICVFNEQLLNYLPQDLNGS